MVVLLQIKKHKSRKEIVVKTFFVLFTLVLGLSGCAKNPAVPFEQRGSSAIPYEETWERAESQSEVQFALGDLGTQKCRPHQNKMKAATGEDYSCRKQTIDTPKGIVDIGLTMPSWYWRLPAPTIITFVYQPDINKRTPFSRAMYLEIDHLRRWEYQRPVQRKCLYKSPMLRKKYCR